MTTPEERDHACAAFLEDELLAYIRTGDDQGMTVHLLYESDGEPVALSRAGEWPLRSYAANHGLILCSVH